MILCLGITLVVLSVILFPLHFHIEGRLDVFVNGGKASIYFFGIKLFNVRLRLELDQSNYNTIYIESFKKSRVLGQVNLTTDIQDKKSIASLMTGSVLGNVNVTDCFVNVEIGRQSDAIFTAMGLTSARIAYCTFMSYVKSWQKIRTKERFVPVYDKNIFDIEFLGIFELNLADIIYGLITQNFFKKKRR